MGSGPSPAQLPSTARLSSRSARRRQRRLRAPAASGRARRCLRRYHGPPGPDTPRSMGPASLTASSWHNPSDHPDAPQSARPLRSVPFHPILSRHLRAAAASAAAPPALRLRPGRAGRGCARAAPRSGGRRAAPRVKKHRTRRGVPGWAGGAVMEDDAPVIYGLEFQVSERGC